jgi:hypothetical protein
MFHDLCTQNNQRKKIPQNSEPLYLTVANLPVDGPGLATVIFDDKPAAKGLPKVAAEEQRHCRKAKSLQKVEVEWGFGGAVRVQASGVFERHHVPFD